MKRKIWMAVVSLILIITFLVCFFNYEGETSEVQKGTFVWSQYETGVD